MYSVYQSNLYNIRLNFDEMRCETFFLLVTRSWVAALHGLFTENNIIYPILELRLNFSDVFNKYRLI